MTHAAVVLVAALVGVWVIAHLLYLGPVQAAAEVTLTWVFVVAAGSIVGGALTVLAFGVLESRSNPAWLRFVHTARTTAAVIGCGLLVVGLLHYRDTEPHGEIRWMVLGVIVLVGAAAVHGWVTRTERKMLA